MNISEQLQLLKLQLTKMGFPFPAQKAVERTFVYEITRKAQGGQGPMLVHSESGKIESVKCEWATWTSEETGWRVTVKVNCNLHGISPISTTNQIQFGGNGRIVSLSAASSDDYHFTVMDE